MPPTSHHTSPNDPSPLSPHSSETLQPIRFVRSQGKATFTETLPVNAERFELFADFFNFFN